MVEAQIQYLPIYIGQEETVFHEEFFENTNLLKKILPDAEKYENVVRVIQISHEIPDSTLTILMDEEKSVAIGFFEP